MNKYNGLSRYKQKKIMVCFCNDLTAIQTARLLGLNRNTIHRYYGMFRRLICAYQQQQLRRMVGIVEVDESYFGPGRVRGKPGPRKRGRGTFKQPVFGVFERAGKVYTEIIADCKAATLLPILRGKVHPASVVYTDGWRGYDGLVDVGYDQHVRINKTETFAKGRAHVNGIESFWSFTKRRLAKFNGVKKNFELHLKECEWRWSKTPQELIRALPHLHSLAYTTSKPTQMLG
jgi:transposase